MTLHSCNSLLPAYDLLILILLFSLLADLLDLVCEVPNVRLCDPLLIGCETHNLVVQLFFIHFLVYLLTHLHLVPLVQHHLDLKHLLCFSHFFHSHSFLFLKNGWALAANRHVHQFFEVKGWLIGGTWPLQFLL